MHLLSELSKLSDRWHQALAGRQMRKHATVWQLSKLLLGQPVITVNAAAHQLKVSFPAANTAIGVLLDLDILREHGKQNRSRAFQSHEVMNLLYTGLMRCSMMWPPFEITGTLIEKHVNCGKHCAPLAVLLRYRLKGGPRMCGPTDSATTACRRPTRPRTFHRSHACPSA